MTIIGHSYGREVVLGLTICRAKPVADLVFLSPPSTRASFVSHDKMIWRYWCGQFHRELGSFAATHWNTAHIALAANIFSKI